jgi:Ala-tRNA(Pro) deacylase
VTAVRLSASRAAPWELLRGPHVGTFGASFEVEHPEVYTMSGIMNRLAELLDGSEVEYEVIHHHADYRAVQTASDTHTQPGEFAKTVFVWIDGEFALTVLPATHTVSLGKLGRSLRANEIRLASEWEMKDLCPDCEVGAEPPFGNLFDLPVYVCPALARDEHITFNAGSHTDAVRMAYSDFERIVRPRVVHMSKHEEIGADESER